MAIQEARSVSDLDGTVVDADFHLTEQVSDIIPYMEEPWSKLLTGHNPFDEDADYYNPFPDPGILAHHVVTGRAQIFSPDAVRSTEDVIEGIELLNVDRPLITPGAVMLRLGIVHHDEVAAALAHACNEFVLDTIVDESKEIKATITIAGQNPTQAAEEIDDRQNESDIVGVYFPTAGVNPPLGDQIYDPIYDACERAGLPLVMHGVGAGTMKSFPVQYDGFSRAIENHIIAHPFQHMVNATSLIIQGVPVRYPDIDFVFQESGLGWIPFLMNRLDHEYYQQRDDAPLLDQPPSNYVDERFYFTSQPIEGTEENPEYVCQIARLLNAPNNLMWASDYPHHDFDHSDTIFRVLAREFNDEELTNIFGRTANKVFFS